MYETSHLIIRSFSEEDYTDFAGLIRDKMASPYAVYDSMYPTDDASLKQILRYFSGTDEFYAVVEKASSKVIGFVALNAGVEPGVRNLGYCLHTAYQGRGRGTEAVRRIIRFAEEQLGLKKLVAGTASENKPSVALLTKLGFRKISQSRGSFTQDERGNPIEFTGYSFELVLHP